MTEKEPWQMTRSEYVDGRYRSPGMHMEAVRQALSAGKPVSQEVLEDYPQWQSGTKEGELRYLMAQARERGNEQEALAYERWLAQLST